MAGKNGIAQPFPDLAFHHLTVQNGLTNNITSCIIQDKQGFIWIGTGNGLNRYDGYRMKQFYHSDSDSNSLINNVVQGLFCDSRGRIWISTGGGVSCFCPSTNRFINYSAQSRPSARLKINTPVKIIEDRNGHILISHQADVIFCVRENMSLEPITLNIPSYTFANVQRPGYDGLAKDIKGNEWAFTLHRIYLLNPQTKQPQQTFSFDAQLGNDNIENITGDENGNYWVSTWSSGLWRFDPHKGTLSQVTKLSVNKVVSWHYNNNNWIAAIGSYSCVQLINSHTNAAQKIEGNPSDPYSITGKIFNWIYSDHQNNLWIATDAGVNYVQTSNKVFDVFPVTEPGTYNYQRDRIEVPYSFFEDSNETWISKRYKSTMVYDENMHLKNCYTSLYPLSSVKRSWRLLAYYFFKRQQELYISTDSGLVVYNLLHSTSQLYLPALEKNIMADFRTIIPLNDHEIMIRTFSNGVYIFNTTTKQFTKNFCNKAGTASCVPQHLNYLFKNRKGEIFLTAGDGVNLLKYQPDKDLFLPVVPVNEKEYNIHANVFFGIDEDSLGRLWIASSNGIFVYNPQTNIVEAHYTYNGKMGSTFRLCFDRYGNVWANGNSGIWCYVVSKNEWISFNGQDGLPGNDFEGIIARKKNGDIIAGLEGAFAVFHPDKLSDISNNIPVFITEASVNDSSRSFIVNRQKQLELVPGQNSFSVDFAVLNYYNASSTQYLYKLEPLMPDFRSNNNGHINFNGLMPGHYVLHVMGADKAGNIYPHEDVLQINIQPAWYQTLWFKILALALIGTGLLLLVRRRIARIKKESLLKQKIIETEMQALRAQMDPHFIFNSLSSIENFIMQNEKRLASDYLNKFARLIRMILDSSRNELVLFSKDMEALQLYIDLEQISFNNKFIYKTDIDPVLLNEDYRVPSLLIQPYVENAIVHGLTHSREPDLMLTVKARVEQDHIKYVIEDNGIGRTKAAQYRMRNKPYHKSVGLQITQERINLFNGAIKGNGSVTIIDLYDEHKNAKGTRVEITIKAI